MELNTALIFSICGLLVFLTNVIVEIIKQVFVLKGERTINIVALSVAMALTITSYFIYIEYMAIDFVWYYLFAAIVLGFVVALVAMVGWDKVLKLWQDSKRGQQNENKD